MNSAEQLTAQLHKKTARVGVIGLGYTGLPLAVELARAGFYVTGLLTICQGQKSSKRGGYSQWTWRDFTRGKTRVIPKMALEAPPRFPWRSACCQAPAVRGGAAPSPEPPPTAQQAVCTERGFPRLPGGITGQTPHQLPSQPENCSRRRSGCRLLHRMLRSLRSLRRPPSTPEKWTFQLWLDTRIDITAPLGDDGSDTTAHSCSVVASAATSTVHHYVATSIGTTGYSRTVGDSRRCPHKLPKERQAT